MSAGVGIWKDVLLKAAHIPVRKPALATPAPGLSLPALQPISSLVQQIFSPAATVQRTHVLFAAADAGTKVSAVCEQVGRALSEMSGATVAIMESSSSPSAAAGSKKRPRNGTGGERWRNYSSQITEHLWRVPSGLMSNRHHPADAWISAEIGELPFDYILFDAVVTDSETPLFCSFCDGAVLVLTANHTRREAALRAKEQLLQCNAELLGTVLDGRTFPVPEAIYRWL
jgi:hypothetical protein